MYLPQLFTIQYNIHHLTYYHLTYYHPTYLLLIKTVFFFQATFLFLSSHHHHHQHYRQIANIAEISRLFDAIS